MNPAQTAAVTFHVKLWPKPCVVSSELYRLGILDAEGLGSDLLHLLLGLGTVVVVGGGVGDLVDNLHALDDLAEGGVLAVEVGSLIVHDKELASGRVGHHAASHAQNAAVMLEIVLGKAVVLELALDAIAGATHASRTIAPGWMRLSSLSNASAFVG